MVVSSWLECWLLFLLCLCLVLYEYIRSQIISVAFLNENVFLSVSSEQENQSHKFCHLALLANVTGIFNPTMFVLIKNKRERVRRAAEWAVWLRCQTRNIFAPTKELFSIWLYYVARRHWLVWWTHKAWNLDVMIAHYVAGGPQTTDQQAMHWEDLSHNRPPFSSRDNKTRS